MIYRDGHDPEMAKWAYDRLGRARQNTEDEQRQVLVDLDESACSAVKEP